MMFTDNELKSMDDFKRNHIKCYKENDKTGSKHINFVIRTDATGIGFTTTIQCGCCGEKIDITDFDVW